MSSARSRELAEAICWCVEDRKPKRWPQFGRPVDAINLLPDVILPFPSGIVRSGSKVGSKYAPLKASTNEKWCPSLRGQTESALLDGEQAVYEIVIDGLSHQAVAAAMLAGLTAAAAAPGVLRISAGNYGGKLGPHHFHLLQLESTQQTAS